MTTEQMRAEMHRRIDRMRPFQLGLLAAHMGVLPPVTYSAHEPQHPHSEDAGKPWNMA